MNDKTTPATATTAAVPNIDKSKVAETHTVQALKTEESDKAKPAATITPAPKS